MVSSSTVDGCISVNIFILSLLEIFPQLKWMALVTLGYFQWETIEYLTPRLENDGGPGWLRYASGSSHPIVTPLILDNSSYIDWTSIDEHANK